MRLVELYAGGEPEVLKKDFYNSLLAAFEPKEIEHQLSMSRLAELSVTVISDRHMIICGEKMGC
jgi:hypothetical protein